MVGCCASGDDNVVLPCGRLVIECLVDLCLENYRHVGEPVESFVKSLVAGSFAAHYGGDTVPSHVFMQFDLAKCIVEVDG